MDESDRAELIEAWAKGWPLYGPLALVSDMRKAELATAAARVRREMLNAGEKVTEARVDEMAHTDLEYTTWLRDSVNEAAKWAALDARKRDQEAMSRLTTALAGQE